MYVLNERNQTQKATCDFQEKAKLSNRPQIGGWQGLRGGNGELLLKDIGLLVEDLEMFWNLVSDNDCTTL